MIPGQDSCEEETAGTPGTWPALALCALDQAGLWAEWNYSWSAAIQNMCVTEMTSKLTNVSLIPRLLSFLVYKWKTGQGPRNGVR